MKLQKFKPKDKITFKDGKLTRKGIVKFYYPNGLVRIEELKTKSQFQLWEDDIKNYEK